MKLKLYGLETYEVAKKYPPFVLDSKEYPELELEMLAVAEADYMGNTEETQNALEELYIKMYDTPAKGSFGDEKYAPDIMSIVAPFDGHDEAKEDYGDETIKFKLVAVDNETSGG
tara:strand:- start:1527 stop:1871 length:345 start_codon:yes stop_codon:yes gene_type:complete